MIFAEGDWVLDQVDTVDVSDYSLENGDTVTLERIDRDDSELLDDGNVRSNKDELQGSAVYVGVGTADREREAIGTNANYDTEVVIGVRVVGLHEAEYGPIDPDGTNGIPFGTVVDRVQNAIDGKLESPNVSNGDTDKHVLIINESPGVTDWADYYRYDFDCAFSKWEDR